MNVAVVQSGFLTSVQDLGRAGFRKSGVSVGGALDAHALRVANALVGNDDKAAGLEATLGKLQLRFEDQRIVAWCGGAFSVRIAGEELPPGHAALVAKDEELIMTAPDAGSRAWLAISGGIDSPLVLGSRSTDLRGNFGGFEGRSLRNGDSLPLGTTESFKERRFPNRRLFPGDSQSPARWISEWSAPTPWASTARRDRFLRIVRGAHWDGFTTAAQLSLVTTPFTVTSDSDRMGARLDGPVLDRADPSDLLSEAVAPGTLQVPPNGKPILLLGDCQTIGGYPKIAHVITVDLPLAAQLWPGDAVRFQEVLLADAQALLREREQDFSRFRIGLDLHQP
ncbi:MAG TPA: biotin-dependent carboxyltransferase family protein [Chthoniobacterales bacterium]